MKVNTSINGDARTIEYLHIAAYLVANPESPLGVARLMLQTMASALGVDEVEDARADIAVTTRDSRTPTSAWRVTDAKEATLLERNANIVGRLAAEDMRIVDRAIWHLILSMNRRGSVYKYWDWKWTYTYVGQYVNQHVCYDAHIRLSVRTDYFVNDAEKARPREFVNAIIQQLCKACQVYYLLVQPTVCFEDGAGLAFEHGGVNGGLAAQIVQELWDKLGKERHYKVRGVFWGQYLSSSHLDRLGGKASFVRDYLALANGRPGSDKFVTDIDGGGVFIKLCDNPMNFSLHGLNVPCQDLGAWLHQRFRQSQLLI